LRRRRGQREPLPGASEVEPEPRPAATPVALFDAVEPGYVDDKTDDAVEPERPQPDTARRAKGRPSMPSWDEIVFGARTDES
ncbi:hypothetical protein HR12_24635, partial [Microbacterium sp. SUBG005]